ncbi:MAG: DNA methyltransferase [Chloroflexi bacterium]|nr:DNA methyltransferase [Chloroflexota bacterium]
MTLLKWTENDSENLLTIAEASRWASSRYERPVSRSNITYLVTYGRVRSVIRNGSIMVDRDQLQRYYDEEMAAQREAYKQLEADINRRLAFTEYSEKERTKHVHRLHPYKGKFIPQLVEYFLDDHIDEYKSAVYFKPGDMVLDPFCGSGTTLVQAAELGIHAVGIDVSAFNTMISNTKVRRHDNLALVEHIREISRALMQYYENEGFREFDNELAAALSEFNATRFPSPTFKLRARQKDFNANAYGAEQSGIFAETFQALVAKYGINLESAGSAFLDKWYLPSVRAELELLSAQIKRIADHAMRETLCVILSRTIRSARATTHLDLATLKEPMRSTYYCRKHLKICKPLFTLTEWWARYADDAVRRFVEFDKIRTDTYQIALTGDSRSLPLDKLLALKQPALVEIFRKQKISGIFTSPPYVGMINYHEQHAYAYELLGIERRDDKEIGPLFKGKGKAARASYVEGVSDVLRHCQKYLKKDCHVFLVANDKHNLYPDIAERADMKIVSQFKRPVLRRSEVDKSPYSESIFHLRRK